VQRVKDVEHFKMDLARPFPLPMSEFVDHSVVTQAEIEQDGQAFMAFAAAFGVSPPRAVGDPAASAT